MPKINDLKSLFAAGKIDRRSFMSGAVALGSSDIGAATGSARRRGFARP